MKKVLITGGLAVGKTRLAEALKRHLDKVGYRAVIVDGKEDFRRRTRIYAAVLLVTAEEPFGNGHAKHIQIRDLPHGNALIKNAASIAKDICS